MKKDSIEYHYDRACNLGIQRVEKLARTILRNHPQYDEFIMGMGSCFFTLKGKEAGKGDIVSTVSRRMNDSYNYVHYDTYKYFKPLNDFIGKWDAYLKLTGEAMRFTAKGKKVTDW